MMIDFTLTPSVIVCLSVMVVCLLYLIFGFRRYVVSVSRRIREDSSEEFPNETEMEYPAISVIVYAEDDAENLQVLLPQILNQEYPAPFEVIVVNDGAGSSTKDVIARLEPEHPNLYMTFTPSESRSVSRKKLGVTLGIKAARYDVLVHTTGNCQVPSPRWLKAIGRRFEKGTDVVICYAAPTAAADVTHEPNKRLHAFDTVRSAIEYLSWAIAGRPYRGTGHNLAYRRDLFFSNNGFSRSLDLKYGDDDVFISGVSNGSNTAVELSTDSMVLAVEAAPAQSHREKKLRYDFTASKLRGCARGFFKTCTIAWWGAILSAVATAIVGLPSLTPAIIAAVLLLAIWLILMFAWKRTSLSLWSRGIFLTFPWFMSVHPIYSFIYWIRGFASRKSNYSWG
ncbi:MAG: glycosyltransferase [Duncaniella sp.]|nr:glycosyltransferase [Duncaniella sp.]